MKSTWTVGAAAFIFAAFIPHDTEELPTGEMSGSLIDMAKGAFRPIWRHVLWIEVGGALAARQYLDALSALRQLESADGADWRAAAFRAHVVAYDIGSRESSPSVRAIRVVEALRILERAAARSTAPELCLSAGVLLMEPWVSDPAVAARIERSLKATPIEFAARWLDEGMRRAPGSGEIRVGAVEAWRLRGIELLSRDGDRRLSSEALRKAADAALRMEKSLARSLAEAWASLDAALDKGASEALVDAGTRLRTLLGDAKALGEAGALETTLFQAALPGLTHVAESRFAAKDVAGCLSVLRVALSIPAPPEAGITQPKAIVDRLVELLAKVASADQTHTAEANELSERIRRTPR